MIATICVWLELPTRSIGNSQHNPQGSYLPTTLSSTVQPSKRKKGRGILGGIPYPSRLRFHFSSFTSSPLQHTLTFFLSLGSDELIAASTQIQNVVSFFIPSGSWTVPRQGGGKRNQAVWHSRSPANTRALNSVSRCGVKCTISTWQFLTSTVPMVLGGDEIHYVTEELTNMPHPPSTPPVTETMFWSTLPDCCLVCHVHWNLQRHVFRPKSLLVAVQTVIVWSSIALMSPSETYSFRSACESPCES